MAQKKTPKKQSVSQKRVTKKVVPQTGKEKTGSLVTQRIEAIQTRRRAFLSRRPHRSFRRTQRRDYTRSLKLPGYWAFTNHVRRTLWRHKKIMTYLVVTYGLLSAIFVGLASQDTYSTLSDTLQATSGDIFQGNLGEVGKAGLLLLTGLTGSFNTTPTEAQQIYAVIFGLLAWLTTVWLLRGLLAGQKPKLRDGIYNAGAPIITTFLVLMVLAIQLLPLALATIVFSAAVSSGFIEDGVAAMALTIGALLLVTLSLYWVTSTLIALVVVTLPGMYPMQAIKTAGDLVVGRRLRLLLRLLWVFFVTAVIWIIIMVPIILFDAWIKSLLPTILWVPIVPVTLLTVSSFALVWSASYVYLLYRRVVEDDAAPA
ncbi:MAG: hypothetical protein ABJA64_00795 [Candidatus Saccharibacteria bacterium]